MSKSEIKKEILLGNHLEHFKVAKEFAMIYPINHPKRIAIENAINGIAKELN